MNLREEIFEVKIDPEPVGPIDDAVETVFKQNTDEPAKEKLLAESLEKDLDQNWYSMNDNTNS